MLAPRRLLRWLLGSLALVLVSAPGLARAWVEVHVVGDEVRLSIAPDGSAVVEHKLAIKVAGGPLKTFDVRGVDPDATPLGDAIVLPTRSASSGTLAGAEPLAIEVLPPKEGARASDPARLTGLRATFADRGLGRGAWLLKLRYKTSLTGRALALGGPLATLTWSGPAFDDGLDSIRLVIDLPAGPTPPKHAPTEAEEGPSVLSTTRRAGDRDELELLRPYTPKGEAPVWRAELDARIFGWKQDARATAPASPSTTPLAARRELATLSRAPSWIFALVVGLVALVALLVAAKHLEHARACRESGATPRPVVPLPLAARALFAGLSLGAGVLVELRSTSPAGAALVALAALFAMHRAPRVTERSLRGPGKWLYVRRSEALGSPGARRLDVFDAGSPLGLALFVLSSAGVAAAIVKLAPVAPTVKALLAADVVVLFAIFLTGRRAELPPDPASAPARFLSTVSKLVSRGLERSRKARERYRVLGRVRMPDARPDVDELRLAIVPKTASSGLSSIEVGMSYVAATGGFVGIPEVLVRVARGSAAERDVTLRFGDHARASRGKRPGEQVLAFHPTLASPEVTARLVLALAVSLAPEPPLAPSPPATVQPARAARRPKGRRNLGTPPAPLAV